MKKHLLVFCLLLFCCGMFADIEPLHFYVDTAETDWQEKLKENIGKYSQVDTLMIWIDSNAIPDLPEHDFRDIRIFSSTKKDISLASLAKFKLENLTLSQGNYRDLNRINRSNLRVLKFHSAQTEISGLDFPALTFLALDVSEEMLDLRKIPHLSQLYIRDSEDRALTIILSPETKLNVLDVYAAKVKNLKQLDLSGLEDLTVHGGINRLSELNLPKLRVLRLSDGVTDWELELPELPVLERLSMFSPYAKISLKTIQRNCPKLNYLGLSGKVIDWEVLPELPLKNLHIGYGVGMMYELPVKAPEGCVVTGLPRFYENPYKMWKLWASIVGIFAFAVWVYHRQQKKEMR